MKRFARSSDLSDRTNSVRALTDDSGKVVTQYDYNAYGETLNLKPETLNDLGFTSRPLDSESGLIYMRNRYYSPKLGRFISRDPLGYKNTFYSASTMIDPITVSYHDGANGASQPGFPYNLSYTSGVNSNPGPGPIYIGAYLTKQNTYAMQDMGLYHYAISNPLAYFDPLGLWSLNFTFDANRDKYGIWELYSDDGEFVTGGRALARGSGSKENGGNHSNWWAKNGDTPTGIYSFNGFKAQNDKKKFGTEKTIAMTPVSGNAERAMALGRAGILIHEGAEDARKGVSWENDYKLKPTNGCIRLTHDDMALLNQNIRVLMQNGDDEGAIRVGGPQSVLPEDVKKKKFIEAK